MELSTLIGYMLTFIFFLSPISLFIQMICALPFIRAGTPLLGYGIGGILSWWLVNFSWIKFEGSHIPISVLVISFIVILPLRGLLFKETPTYQTGADQMGALIMGIILYFTQESVRWY